VSIPASPRPSDADLVRRARSGEADAFATLVRLHAAGAIRAANAVLRDGAAAEDAAQEAFWKAWRALPAYEERERFGAWIARIAVRCAIDMVRRRRPELPLEAASEASSERLESRIADREALRRALAQLSARDRAIVRLRDSEGMTVAEVAQLVGISEASVRVRAFRAKRKLRRILREES
jgi:RNA polymerase sigma-70 factor (ECF subfamily)